MTRNHWMLFGFFIAIIGMACTRSRRSQVACLCGSVPCWRGWALRSPLSESRGHRTGRHWFAGHRWRRRSGHCHECHALFTGGRWPCHVAWRRNWRICPRAGPAFSSSHEHNPVGAVCRDQRRPVLAGRGPAAPISQPSGATIMSDPIVIVSAARPPWVACWATLRPSASDLGAVAVKAAVERAGLKAGADRGSDSGQLFDGWAGAGRRGRQR